MDNDSIQVQDVQPEGQGEPETTPSAVQPESQGQQASSLYSEALSTVPEEHRQYVEPHFKEWDRRVQEKLTEAAEYRKRFDPYEQFTEYDPEELSGLVEWARELDPDDPDAVREALLTVAENFGVELTPEQASEFDIEEPDPVLSTVEELKAWKEQQEQERQLKEFEAEEGARLLHEWNEVQEQHGKEFTDQEAETLKSLAQRFAAVEDEPIKAAYEFMQNFRGQIENALVSSQPNQPAPAEAGGRADNSVKPVEDFDEAERLHRERSKQRALA